MAVARSFYSQAQVYFWDDTISALDVITEKHVVGSVFEINKDSILIMATHRISALKNFDRIYYLQSGEITEVGSYDQLIQKQGQFFQFLQSQNSPKSIEVFHEL